MQSHTISQSQPYNTHWAPLRFVRRYFISVLLSPLAANNFCSPAAPLRLRSLSAALCTDHCTWLISSLISPCSTKAHLHRSAAYVHFVKYAPAATHGACIGLTSFGLYCKPLVGARSHLRKLRWLTAARLQRFSADKCAAHGSTSFLPQALLPAFHFHYS